MHPHHHHQQQHQAMYAQQQQQQQANMLFYQYNQLQSMQANYSNPALTPARYMQQSIEQQQGYRPDQLVPQSSPQVTSPIQQQIQRSSPINMVPTSSPNTWINSASLQNPAVFLPIIRNVSNTQLDAIPYASSTSTPPVAMSFESPKLNRHHHSKRHSLSDHQRQRLHSGSSCYESDAADLSSNDDDEIEVKKIH
jgi:hypothetical protein